MRAPHPLRRPGLHALITFALLAAIAAPGHAAGTSAANAPDPLHVAAVDNPARTAKDRERDQRDRPAELLALLGLRPGMAIADVFGGGGYWSELFANVVGPGGRVLLVNNPPYADFAGKALGERLKDGRLPNVESRVATPADLRLGEGTLDAAVIFMSYHDLYYVDTDWPAIDAGQFLEQIRRAVKPGGAFLIVDHAAKDGSGKSAAQKLHRIDERFAKRDIERHGFRLEKTWDGLRVPADDRSLSVFDDKIRGHTDRFVHLYRRR